MLKAEGKLVIVEHTYNDCDIDRLKRAAEFYGLILQHEAHFTDGAVAGFCLAFGFEVKEFKLVQGNGLVTPESRAVEQKEDDHATTEKDIRAAQLLLEKDLRAAIDHYVDEPDDRHLLVANTMINPLLMP